MGFGGKNDRSEELWILPSVTSELLRSGPHSRGSWEGPERLLDKAMSVKPGLRKRLQDAGDTVVLKGLLRRAENTERNQPKREMHVAGSKVR